jgi:hypothetical protein
LQARNTEVPDDAFLLGRERELGLLAALLDGVSAGGGSLLIAGEPGTGKTALLDAAAQLASAAGFRVLRAAATEFEAGLGFAALNQVLLPLRDEFAQVSRASRDALDVALGFGTGPAPDRLSVSNATVELLGRAAADRPVLMIVDDLQWLDRASAAVLGSVARRLVGVRAGFLGSLRSGQESFFERADLPGLELGPLDGRSSGVLLDTRFPALRPGAGEAARGGAGKPARAA